MFAVADMLERFHFSNGQLSCLNGMAPNHNDSGVAQSSGSRRNTRASRRIRKRAGVSGNSTGNSPSKRVRAQNANNSNTTRRQNTSVNRRNNRVILSDSSSSDEEILDLSQLVALEVSEESAGCIRSYLVAHYTTVVNAYAVGVKNISLVWENFR
uniref:Pecanex-like protein n=1 Tax=Ascaris lumbricoides TaxID=6252 RepID=A0A0M3IQX3_ASCLU